jgi:hypothetical protein
MLDFFVSDTRTLLEAIHDPEQLTASERAAIVHGLNEVVKNRRLPTLPDLQDTIKAASLHDRVRNRLRLFWLLHHYACQ